MENRVLVAGAWSWNKGAEAMLRAVQAGILAQLPGVTGLLQGPPNTSVAPEILRGLQVWSFDRSRVSAGEVTSWDDVARGMLGGKWDETGGRPAGQSR